jgi:hypothetical protein
MSKEDKKKNKVTLAVTVDSDIKEELSKSAKQEERTLSNYVNMILRRSIGK